MDLFVRGRPYPIRKVACLLFLVEHVFPDKEASNSVLIRRGDRILMLNRGFAVSSNGVIRKGDPFLASFNMSNGKMDYQNIFEKDRYIHQFGYSNDTITTLTYNKITQFKASDGTSIATGNFDLLKDAIIEPGLDRSRLFLKTGDSSFHSLQELGAYKYLVDPYRVVYKLNEKLEAKEVIPRTRVWTRVNNYRGLQVLQSSEATIIARDGRELMNLKVAGMTKVYNGQLYIAAEKDMFVVDLKGLITN